MDEIPPIPGILKIPVRDSPIPVDSYTIPYDSLQFLTIPDDSSRFLTIPVRFLGFPCDSYDSLVISMIALWLLVGKMYTRIRIEMTL